MLTLNEENFLNDVFLTLKKYLNQTGDDHLVTQRHSVNEIKQLLPDLSPKAVSPEQLLEELDVILKTSVNTGHPLFMNQLQGGFNTMAWVGEVVSALLNPTMATFEIAPALTVIEKRLVGELLRIMGFAQGEGIMVTGGSNSNLLAVLCARTDYNPSIRHTGFAHNRFRIYVSAEAHYSFDKAANISGIGTQNLILIPCLEDGSMNPEELERTIRADINDGYIPLMVGATAGTTVLGAFDPFKKIANICEKYKIWMHVDAAWGAGALFTRKLRSLMDGVELADSVTFDAHKTMGTPLITSFFLTKRPGILRNTTRGGGAEYLFHDYENSEWDTGTYSLQCGRRADALKFWLLWRAYGTDGLIERTEHLLSLAEYAVNEVRKEPRFRLVHSHYLNVCFQVVPRHHQENINGFTLKVRELLVQEGRAMVNYAKRADGTIFFRLVFPNHQTSRGHISEVLKIILEKADLIENLRSP